jgi:hypothetical protein
MVNRTHRVNVYQNGKDHGWLGRNQNWWFDPGFVHSPELSAALVDDTLPDVSKGHPARITETPLAERCKALAKDCLPPILWRALRSLKPAPPIPTPGLTGVVGE